MRLIFLMQPIFLFERLHEHIRYAIHSSAIRPSIIFHQCYFLIFLPFTCLSQHRNVCKSPKNTRLCPIGWFCSLWLWFVISWMTSWVNLRRNQEFLHPWGQISTQQSCQSQNSTKRACLRLKSYKWLGIYLFTDRRFESMTDSASKRVIRNLLWPCSLYQNLVFLYIKDVFKVIVG